MLKHYYFNGPYGVIDIFQRNVWINFQDESIAHAVRKTFSSKVGLIVYDLRCFENYSEDPPLVDTDCCLDWQIGVENDEKISSISLSSIHLTQTIRKNPSPVLINKPVESLLNPERRKELQTQMALYATVLIDTELHLPLDSTTIEKNLVHLKFDHQIDYNAKFFAIYQQVNTIFSRNLHIDTIAAELQKLSDTHIIKEYPEMAFKILRILGRVYE